MYKLIEYGLSKPYSTNFFPLKLYPLKFTGDFQNSTNTGLSECNLP
jgi:hypothetical protein